jgi:uncharacterized protein YdeI (YjbR/CyaY-like superfamily)
MNTMNPKLDAFFRNSKKWQKEMKTLRKIILDCELTEEMKWRLPCYTLQDNNIVIIQPFKDYCAIMFFKGALLKDASGLLTRIGKNTQSGRQIRFTTVQEIMEMETIVKAYIHEAIEVEKAGLKVNYKKTSEFTIPEEFQKTMDKIPALKAAFDALTPGRQRAYIFYFSAAKQSKTRESRVAKCVPKILGGKGLDDE